MAKGYWIAHVNANDTSSFASDNYKAYVAEAGPMFQKYNGKFLARGGASANVEGQDLGARHVVIEFPSLDDAKACYNSDTYQAAKKHRTAVSSATIILVEGFDG